MDLLDYTIVGTTNLGGKVNIKSYIQDKIDRGIKPNYFVHTKNPEDSYIKSMAKAENLKVTEWIYRQMFSFEDICPDCGRKLWFQSFERGYSKTCTCKRIENSHNSRVKNKIAAAKKNMTEDNLEVLESPPINQRPWKFKCKTCGHIFFKWMKNGRSCGRHICEKCYSTNKSKMEFELIEKTKDLNPIHGHRIGGKEIDIYYPSREVGVELNGVYWHKDDRNRHNEKRLLAEKNSVRLIQFTDIDWRDKKEIVLSMVFHALGKTKYRIHARQTKIDEVPNKVYRKFCEENHIKGYAPASLKLGAFLGNELVSVFSLSKSRYTKEEYECIRFCSKKYTHVAGMLSKFLAYIEKETPIDQFITYADLHYGTGNSYKAFMEYLGTTPPNYFYTDKKSVYSRQRFQKHKLEKLFPDIYDKTKTEKEIMESTHYFRYYDCGNKKFRWKRKGLPKEP